MAATGPYALDLGSLTQGTGQIVQVGVRNGASGPADLLSAVFSVTGDGVFANTLASFTGLGAGQEDQAPQITLDTSHAGTFSETVTLYATGSNASGYSGALAAETITITGKVVPGLAVAQVNTASPVDFGKIRQGAASGIKPIRVSNAAAATGEALDVSIAGVSGAATASGQHRAARCRPDGRDGSQCRPGYQRCGGSERQRVAGRRLGSQRHGPPSQSVQVTGAVYREPTGSVSGPQNLIVHVGEAGTAHLTVQNTAAADGYSEKLSAVATGATGGLTGATGNTGLIAAGSKRCGRSDGELLDGAGGDRLGHGECRPAVGRDRHGRVRRRRSRRDHGDGQRHGR